VQQLIGYFFVYCCFRNILKLRKDKGRGVVGVHCAAEAKKQFYQQTEKEIDAVKSEL
jgi:hypothetical protein